MDAASPTYQGRVWHNKDTAVGLAQIVELRDGVGLHFVAISTQGTSAAFCLQMPDSLDAQFPPEGFEAYFEVPKTDAGSYLLSVCDGARTKTITVNLPALHVPGDLWKE
jgi:hypothetical protein